MRMPQRTLTLLLLIASIAVPQEADLQKAVQKAIEAGNLPKAKQLCDAWAEKKPDDEQPYLSLGRIYSRLDLMDRALEQFEIARAIDPLSPEPSCELGRLFLKARKAQQAIVEFQAALKVLKGYEPARKGLAEAEELLANPYRDGVHIKLGESNEEYGLKQLRKEQSRVSTIGGRQCRGMDVAGHVSFLYFDVDDEYLSDVDLPVKVTVEYYDEGSHYFRLKYDSTDPGAHWHGAHKRAERVKRTDSKTWKKHTFSLPDARLANRASGADLILWRDRENLHVASVHVVRGGLAASVEPRVAACHGICVVTAKVEGAQGPVPDGTTVRFATDRGTIAAEAETVGGEARADLEAGDQAGEAIVTVQAGEDKCAVLVPILQGRGEIVRRRLLLDRFQSATDWQKGGTKGTEATLDTGPALDHDGRPSTKLVYKLAKGESNTYVSLARTMLLPGRPTSLGLWVRQDATSGVLNVDLVDATGQIHSFALGAMKSPKWHWMEQAIGQATHRHGGANDGRLHLPVRLRRLFLRRGYGARARDVEGGEISLRNLVLVTEIPESETVLLDVVPDGPSADFDVATGAAFRSNVVNLRGERLQAPLRWSITNDEDRVVVEGSIEGFEVEAATRRSERTTQRLDRPGVYRATFTLEVDDSDVEVQQEALSKHVAFLILRDVSQIGLSTKASPVDRGRVVQIANAGDEKRQFALSYRLLNARYEVVRRCVPDEPNMTMEPGEALDLPVSLDRLTAGRYRALLLFDMAGGERFTRLLPLDVYPDVATLPVKIVAEDDTPIPDASVRARLVQRPHRRLDNQDRTLQEWDVQTDEMGLCELAELRVPGDPSLCRVYVDVVAEGLADRQRTTYLSRLVRPDVSPSPTHTVRLSRGVALKGRVVGGDGQPVSDARVTAMGVLRKRNRIHRISWHRPRTTDADGRFEVNVSPDMEIELTAYAAQWAPKGILVPAGKQDSGDIQLQPGAVVKGTFLDEQGKPVSGYWVTLESCEHGPSSIMVSPVVVAAQTGPDGTFVLPPLKGPCVLSTPASLQPWATGARRHSPQPRIVARPQSLTLDRDDVELKLRAVPQVRVAGRVLDIDGKPLRDTRLRLNQNQPICHMTSDQAVTDENGRFMFEGIPSGQTGMRASVSTLRPWKRDKQIYLRAKPIKHDEWQNGLGAVADKDVLDLDFQFCFWSSRDGFMDTSPDGRPVPRPKRGLMAGLGDALQGIAKSLAQTTSLTGRVLDEAGNGLQGAQVRVELVRPPNAGQKGKEQVIGSWNTEAGADGTYVLAAMPVPPEAERYRVRVEIAAEGYAKMEREVPLRELLKPGVRTLRMPDLRLATEGNE